MSAPAVIDSVEFALAARQLAGSLPATSLGRLDDLTYDAEGGVDYKISGEQDGRGRPRLRLRITGRLHLRCQRCLGLLAHEIDVTNTLLIVAPGAIPAGELDDPEGPDTVDASAELDVAALVEDEVLLSLPLAPRHPEGACGSRMDKQDDEGADARSAFGKLAALKRPR